MASDLRNRGYAISDAVAKRIANDLYKKRRALYNAFWPHPPVSLAGNTKPGEFEAKFALLEEYANANGDCRPPKRYRPKGVNLYQWLMNQQNRMKNGTMPDEQVALFLDLPGGAERFEQFVQMQVAAA